MSCPDCTDAQKTAVYWMERWKEVNELLAEQSQSIIRLNKQLDEALKRKEDGD